MFPKAQCGGDFLKALVDGRITIDVADNKMGQYFNQYSYFNNLNLSTKYCFVYGQSYCGN